MAAFNYGYPGYPGGGAPSKPAAPIPENIQAKSQGRLMKEQKMMHEQRDEMAELGIYVRWDENVLTKVKALIVGPPETPYQNGFFFFDVDFPGNYPYAPPKVMFRTGDGRVRFNPNLYVEGKVCLSILGTWQGPGWTSICNLRSVLITIQSLMSNHPITNEPGHENSTGKKEDTDYNKILTYETVHVGVLKMHQMPPTGFEIFREELNELFAKNYETFEPVLKKYDSDQGKVVRSPIWQFSCTFDPKKVREGLKKELAKIAGNNKKAGTTTVGSPKKGPVAVESREKDEEVLDKANCKTTAASTSKGTTTSSSGVNEKEVVAANAAAKKAGSSTTVSNAMKKNDKSSATGAGPSSVKEKKDSKATTSMKKKEDQHVVEDDNKKTAAAASSTKAMKKAPAAAAASDEKSESGGAKGPNSKKAKREPSSKSAK
ncbi:unnamed protein product [Amoebophrya sp. A120]|nr:unnamed protein product [Amoebophrya sp. A120]|eukprot:GSA120T00024318001.1